MIICPSFFDGRLDGIGRVSGMVYDTFQKMGYDPQILSANDPQETCPQESSFGYGRHYPKMMLAALTQNFSPPKIIVCMHLGLAPVARLIGHRYQVPYLVFLHGIEAWQTLNFRRRWGLRKAHLLLSNSHFTLRHFLHYSPAMHTIPAKITPLGIQLPEQNFSSPNPAVRQPHVLTVGRLDQKEQYKGHRLLIRSLGPILKEIPDAQLIIVGDGDDRQSLEEYALKFPHHAQVKFLGKIPDTELRRLYEESALFAMPSKAEGFGLVYLEAMAHGLACICSDVDAAREVIVHGETGFAIDPDNPFDLAERALQLLQQPELRNRLGQAGRERYLNNFTEKHFQRKIQTVLRPYLVGDSIS